VQPHVGVAEERRQRGERVGDLGEAAEPRYLVGLGGERLTRRDTRGHHEREQSEGAETAVVVPSAHGPEA
jgi:hypothetical protein